MQLRNRLKKIENLLNVGGEFCECRTTQKTEVIHRSDDVDTIQNIVSEFCEECLKPIEKQTIIIEFVRAKKPDWMTGEQYASACGE